MVSRDPDLDERPENPETTHIRERQISENRLMLRDLLETYQGRQYLWRLLERCGIYRMSFKPSEADTTFFNEGQRNVGLSIFHDVMDIDPGKFAMMQAEGAKREAGYQQALRDSME